MSHDSSTTTIHDVPDDLIIDILARLPVKSLIQFKSVSRRWSDIITSPELVSMHLINSRTRNRIRSDTCSGVTVNTHKWMADEEELPNFPYDFLSLHVDDSTQDTSISYKAPYGADAGTHVSTPFSIVGYCDGVFCLSWWHLSRDCERYRSSRIDLRGQTVIALCNPAMRELRVLPMSDSDSPPYRTRGSSTDIGFGFDPRTKDYKVVKIVTFSGSEGLGILEVYSMRSNSWRKVIIKGDEEKYAHVQNIKTFGLHTGIYTSGGGGGGILHWTMDEGQEFLMVSYLMDDDSLRVTRLPSKCEEEHSYFRQRYSMLDEKPALICSSITDDLTLAIEVFVMKSYGELDDDDRDSNWCVAYSEKGLAYRECSPFGYWNQNLLPYRDSTPIGFWKDNLLLMFDRRKGDPFLLDMDTKQTMNLPKLTREMDFFYTETLVSVKPP